MDELVHVGFVLKPHGYLGNVKVALQLEEAQNIQTEWVMLIINNKPVPFFVSEKSESNGEWMLKLEDVDSDIDAKKLQGYQVFVHHSKLPGFVEAENLSLIGFTLIDDQHGDLGPITDEYTLAKQDYLSIQYNGAEVAIPNVSDIIYKVNAKKRKLRSKLPDGLLEINL